MVRRHFLELAQATADRVGSRRFLVNLKRDHSLRVMALAHRILQVHALRPYERILLAALVHDVGRFPQLEHFGTFCDAQSVDHGAEGARLLETSSLLAGLRPEEQAWIRQVVAFHNRRQLPPVAEDIAVGLSVVRDADKLDIVRVVLAGLEAGEIDDVVALGLRPDPGYTPQVLEALAQGDAPDYRHLTFVDDLKLFLAAWGGHLVFAESRRIFSDRNYLGRLEKLASPHPFVPQLFSQFRQALLS